MVFDRLGLGENTDLDVNRYFGEYAFKVVDDFRYFMLCEPFFCVWIFARLA